MPERFGHYEFQNEFGLEKENSVNRCCFAATSLFFRDNRSDPHDSSSLQNVLIRIIVLVRMIVIAFSIVLIGMIILVFSIVITSITI